MQLLILCPEYWTHCIKHNAYEKWLRIVTHEQPTLGHAMFDDTPATASDTRETTNRGLRGQQVSSFCTGRPLTASQPGFSVPPIR